MFLLFLDARVGIARARCESR